MVEATASAIVSCLFRILVAHANFGILDSAIEMVRKAHAMRSTIVDGALYDSAKFFLVNGTKNGSDGGRSEASGFAKQNASASNGASASEPSEGLAGGTGRTGDFERFQPLILAVLSFDESRQASEVENLRKSRVALALALAEQGVQDAAALAAILDTWSQTERSRPLRDDIERARLLVHPKP